MLSQHGVRAVLVVDDAGAFVGVLSDSEMLRFLLPPYVGQSWTLARVLDEAAADVLFRRLDGRTVGDLIPADREVAPVVLADHSLVEVASVMVLARVPVVGVSEEGRLIGGITIEDLLSHLLRRR